MDSQALTALSSLLSILGLVYLVFWCYRALCRDMFRQSMFELRDELFDYALEGHIDFNHPAYGVLRNTMNGYIRFAHHLTAWQGIILALLWFRLDTSSLKERTFEYIWPRATANLTPEVKSHIEQLRRRMDRVAMFYFFVACPELLLIFSPFLLLLSLLTGTLIMAQRFGGSGLVGKGIDLIFRFKNRWRRSDNFALFYGETAI